MFRPTQKIAAMAMLLLLTGCGSYAPKGGYDLLRPNDLYGTDRQKDAFPNDKNAITTSDASNSLASLTDELINLESSVRKDEQNVAARKKYASLAMHLSNQACTAWFDELYIWEVMLEYRKDTTNIAGDFLLAGLGLVETGQKTMSAISMALGASNNVYDNFRSTFLLPKTTLKKVEEKVFGYRETEAKKINEKVNDPNFDFYQLRDQLLAYHRTCHGQTVSNIINNAVEFASHEELFKPVHQPKEESTPAKDAAKKPK